MTKVPTCDWPSLLRQSKALVRTGAELIRVSVRDEGEAQTISRLKKEISVPIIADIHYSERLALAAVAAGADKIRINPGNIPLGKLRPFIREVKQRKIPVRLGINSGSVKWRGQLVTSMVETACDTIKFFEDNEFFLLVVSLKTPSVSETIACYRRLAEKCDYPFHLGITEAGQGPLAEARSILGIGCLLLEGIGDTVRVSLTEPPEKEVLLARSILQAAGCRIFVPEIISCPTCGRTRVNLVRMQHLVKKEVMALARRFPGICRLKIAVMGCEVNGPGEARQADIGLAGGQGRFALFQKGKIIDTFPEKKALKEMVKRLKQMSR